MAPKTRQSSSSNQSTENKIENSRSDAEKNGQKCRHCNQIYENPFIYARHSLMVHHKQVKCPMQDCGRKLKSVAGLMNHFRTTHKNACSLCGHSTKNQQGLRVHLALVHDLKRCVCGVTRRERMNGFFE